MDENTKRLSRLTSILLQLQSKRIVSATALAQKYGISIRTVYRDIRALEQAGVPIVTEEGKGYSLMEGYRLPPVTFSEDEANAIITAEQLLLRNTDSSFVAHFIAAATKIKAVLRHSVKDNADLLASRIAVDYPESKDRSSHNLAELQKALTNFLLVDIAYQKEGAVQPGWRTVEPFALLVSENTWLLAANCRLRDDFRLFRLDRMHQVRVSTEQFTPHKLKLKEYLAFLESRNNP